MKSKSTKFEVGDLLLFKYGDDELPSLNKSGEKIWSSLKHTVKHIPKMDGKYAIVLRTFEASDLFDKPETRWNSYYCLFLTDEYECEIVFEQEGEKLV